MPEALRQLAEELESQRHASSSRRDLWRTKHHKLWKKLVRARVGAGVGLFFISVSFLLLPLSQFQILAWFLLPPLNLALALLMGQWVVAKSDWVLSNEGLRQWKEGLSEAAWQEGQRTWLAGPEEVRQDEIRCKGIAIFGAYFLAADAAALNSILMMTQSRFIGSHLLSGLGSWVLLLLGILVLMHQLRRWGAVRAEFQILQLALRSPYQLRHPDAQERRSGFFAVALKAWREAPDFTESD